MKCKHCGKTITEQTFKLYKKRCVPCFNRLPIPRLKYFCCEILPLFLLILVIPALAAFHFLLKLWHKIAPVPFRRSEIIYRMTPHFGSGGAIEYVNGLKTGFHEGISRRGYNCGTHTFRNTEKTPALCYTIGREDGAMLRLKPKQLQKILDLRCSKPYKIRSSNPRRKPFGKRRTLIKRANQHQY